jgi:hypothetical protein
MRQPQVVVAVGVIGVLTAGCGGTNGNAESPTTTPSMIPRPVVARELPGLLLSPEQVNAAMGATAMTVTNTQTAMSDNTATMAPAVCLAIDGAAEAAVYANSGYWAEHDQSLNDGDKFTHYVKQAVVLFPTAEKPALSSMPPPSNGRPAASTPTRRADRSGLSGRSPTPLTR